MVKKYMIFFYIINNIKIKKKIDSHFVYYKINYLNNLK